MEAQIRRYLFLDFEHLKSIPFKKLQKVASKIFVFVPAEEKYLPLNLVVQAQRFGKALRWVVVECSAPEELNYHIAFQLGKMHRKVDPAIEFAVISNDYAFDSLIAHINAEGRSCLRVKHQPETAPPKPLPHAASSTGKPALLFRGGRRKGRTPPPPSTPSTKWWKTP